MRIATLISWLLTVSLGGYMLRTWIARGGPRRERARPGGLPPQLIFTHAGLALTGLLVWACYAATRLTALAWLAVFVLMAVIGLGICTVTLWTPYPARSHETASVWDEAIVVPDTPDTPATAASQGGPAEPGAAEPGEDDSSAFKITDEMIAELLADPFPRRRTIRPDLTALIPIVHGFGAITTFILAVMTASRA